MIFSCYSSFLFFILVSCNWVFFFFSFFCYDINIKYACLVLSFELSVFDFFFVIILFLITCRCDFYFDLRFFFCYLFRKSLIVKAKFILYKECWKHWLGNISLFKTRRMNGKKYNINYMSDEFFDPKNKFQ